MRHILKIRKIASVSVFMRLYVVNHNENEDKNEKKITQMRHK